MNNPDEALRRALKAAHSGVEPLRHDLAWLQRRACEVFGPLPVAGRAVLEIGCGSGFFCLWAAAHGAERVVGLEPESAGATTGTAQQFAHLIEVSGLPGLACVPQTFQTYEPAGQQFDLVLSYNSINHLDEVACMALLESESARATYRELLGKLYQLLRPGGHLIVWDVAPTNLWHMLGLPNLLEKNMEWHKHQNPKTWQALLAECGFSEFALNWPVYYPLRLLTPLLSNRSAAYCLGSRFRLQATRMGTLS